MKWKRFKGISACQREEVWLRKNYRYSERQFLHGNPDFIPHAAK
jgi:hypothetical protein